jgi:hypothetical protein
MVNDPLLNQWWLMLLVVSQPSFLVAPLAGKGEHSFEIAREWLEPVKGLGPLPQSWLEEV